MQNIDIGAKVQEFRTMRKLSLRQLSEMVQLTPSMLSQIENNLVNPSINTLKEIAKVLEVPMFRFFQDATEPSEMIVRKGENKKIGNPKEDVVYKLLTPNTSGDIEFCLMEIPSNSSTSVEKHEHNGEEVAYIVEGKVEIYVGNKIESLEKGDSIRIPAHVAHKWVNGTDLEVQVIFAITPPCF